MERFRANGASASELPDLNAFAIVLSEGADGTGRRLEIQKALAFDEQDKASGQDTYCLCNELGATHYGGVVSWRIAKCELRLELDADAQRALGARHGYLIEVPSEISELADGLQRLLGPQAR